MSTSKFYSLSNLPTVNASPVGKDIYEWKFLDKVGNLKKEKKNLYEEIQSYKNQVDYKKKIEQGETFEDGNGIYLDTTKFDGDYGDLNEYLASLASNLRAQINPQNNGATGASATVKPNEEIAKTVKESASDTSASGAADNGTKDNGTKGSDGK